MKQTAVEWLKKRAEKREMYNPNESDYWHLKEFQKDLEQAKEMEKEQKIDMLHSIIHDAQMGEDVEDVEAWFKQYENKNNENSAN